MFSSPSPLQICIFTKAPRRCPNAKHLQGSRDSLGERRLEHCWDRWQGLRERRDNGVWPKGFGGPERILKYERLESGLTSPPTLQEGDELSRLGRTRTLGTLDGRQTV